VDGFAVQGHLSTRYGFPGDLQANLQRFDDLGLETPSRKSTFAWMFPPGPSRPTSDWTSRRATTSGLSQHA
jgi:endo-1,4-beta-xylanase